MKFLHLLANACAILGGLILTVITLMTCASLIGRNTIGATIKGDFELTALAAGAAIALFMPLCQYKRGNIIVDFFTAKASDSVNAGLDRLGALAIGVLMALVAWRTAIGAVNAYNTNATSMMMGFPEWTVYILMVPGLILTALIGISQAVNGFDESAS